MSSEAVWEFRQRGMALRVLARVAAYLDNKVREKIDCNEPIRDDYRALQFVEHFYQELYREVEEYSKTLPATQVWFEAER